MFNYNFILEGLEHISTIISLSNWITEYHNILLVWSNLTWFLNKWEDTLKIELESPWSRLSIQLAIFEVLK